MRRRAWAGRIVLAVATLACIATSRRGWQLPATLPADAPRMTPADGTDGLAITVTATHEAYVQCGDAARPLDLATDAAWRTTPVHYLCPPGTTLEKLYSSGPAQGGGCSTPEPPADATIHATVTRAAMWKKDVTVPFDLLFEPANHGERDIAIHATQQAHLAIKLLSPPAGLGVPFVLDGGPRTATLYVSMMDAAHSPAHVEVHATMYGLCPEPSQPCQPPADAVLELTAR